MDDDYSQRLKAYYEELRRELPAEAMSTDDADRVIYSVDASKEQGFADVIVSPKTQDDVVTTVALAGRHRIPIFPRGAGSGMSAGSIPMGRGVVLNLAKLNRIVKLDVANLTAVAEPGVVTGKLQEEAEKHGLFYASDPGSAAFSTIGGNIAENAGGMRAVKYGSTRDHVLALKCVLSTGEVFDTGTYSLMGVTGYDLVRLLVGSEGTLAVFLEATLKLIPLPKFVRTALAQFSREEDALSASAAIIQAGVIPRALEFMGEEALNCVRRYREIPLLKPEANAALLIESDGAVDEVTRHEIAAMKEACEVGENALLAWMEAQEKEQRETLWDVRKSMSPSLYEAGAYKIAEDIAVPRASVREFVAKLRELVGERVRQPIIYGHLGHGSIHVTFVLEGKDDQSIPAVQEAVEEVFKLVVSMGGSISAEHGIGLTKRKYLGIELSPTELRLMREIKRAFDPAGILNPGKIWEE